MRERGTGFALSKPGTTIAAWQRSPVGKAMILNHSEQAPAREVVRVGQTGVTLSALRPMGEGSFTTEVGEVVVQCRSEFGDLPAGAPVRVTHFKDGIATVRSA